MTVDPSRQVRVTRQFAATAERVFDAWLDPKTASQWLFTTPAGRIVQCEIDPQVGGSFVFVDRRVDGDVRHIGEYIEIDRPRRLVFNFSVPQISTEATRVTVEIVPHGSGYDLTLTHENVLPEWMDRVRAGWSMLLDQLAGELGSDDVYGVVTASDTVRFERLLPGPIERVWSYLVDSDKRAQWLAAGEMEPGVGATVELHFHHIKLSKIKVPPPQQFKHFENGHTMLNRVSRYEPPRGLSLTWDDGAGGESEVAFDLTPVGDKVRLVLVHRGLANHDTVVGVGHGWHAHVGILSDRLSGREPNPFWVIHKELDGVYEKRFAKA